MRLPRRVLVLCALIAGALASTSAELPPATEKFIFDVEWRLIHAGVAEVEANPSFVHMKLDSAGLVSALFKIHDIYTVNYEDQFCATSSTLDAQEGKRHHETKITFDRIRNHASYIERDLLKGSIVAATDVDTPRCVHDPIGALLLLRGMKLEPGQSVQLPLGDGKVSVSAKVDAQERETVKTSAGTFKTVRYEANLLNGVLYSRKGRLLFWLTDDARKLPIRIQLRMSFPLGTVTLDLRKNGSGL